MAMLLCLWRLFDVRLRRREETEVTEHRKEEEVAFTIENAWLFRSKFLGEACNNNDPSSYHRCAFCPTFPPKYCCLEASRTGAVFCWRCSTCCRRRRWPRACHTAAVAVARSRGVSTRESLDGEKGKIENTKLNQTAIRV